MENNQEFIPLFESLDIKVDDFTKADENKDDDESPPVDIADDSVIMLPSDADLADLFDDVDTGDDDDNFVLPSTQTNTTPNEEVILGGVSALLQDIGLLQLEEDEKIDSIESLELLLRDRGGRTIMDGLIASTPEVGQDLMSYILNKGDTLTTDDLRDFYNTYLNDVDLQSLEFSDSTIDDARSYLEKKYREKGLRETTIKTSIDALEVENTLLEEANALLNKEKETLSAKTKVQESQVDRTKRLNDEKVFVSKIKESITKSEWKPEKMGQVASIIKNNEIVTFANQALDDPELMVKFAEILTYYDKDKKEFNLEALGKKVATKEVEKTRNSLFSDFMKSSGNNIVADDVKAGGKNPQKASFRTIRH